MKAHLIFSLLLLLSLGSTRAADVCVSERDTGKKIVLHCGDILVVRLPASPTTGYAWNLSISPSDLLIQEKAPQYQPSDSAGKLLGSGGFECWRFRFTKPGIARLSFAYARPWEKGVPPVRQLDFSVRQ